MLTCAHSGDVITFKGTPPTYDVALNTSSTQWVLFLEGGGWCYGDTVAAATTSCASKGGAQWPPQTGTHANSVDMDTKATVAAGVRSSVMDFGGVMSVGAPRGPLHGGRSTRAALRGPLHK